jgi:hypothetical protein
MPEPIAWTTRSVRLTDTKQVEDQDGREAEDHQVPVQASPDELHDDRDTRHHDLGLGRPVCFDDALEARKEDFRVGVVRLQEDVGGRGIRRQQKPLEQRASRWVVRPDAVAARDPVDRDEVGGEVRDTATIGGGVADEVLHPQDDLVSAGEALGDLPRGHHLRVVLGEEEVPLHPRGELDEEPHQRDGDDRQGNGQPRCDRRCPGSLGQG